MRISKTQLALTTGLVVVLTAGVLLAFRMNGPTARTTVTAYFANSNGLFVGDDVLILGVPVGKVSKIEPQPERAKVTFWVDTQYKVPQRSPPRSSHRSW
ncbi:MCE-family protein MCE3d [Mycolicibacterium fortuitum]|uniref:MCE-family protein MCE3d n=1 Tax=Mycolicibacterium fortuitum TaxID=1766 RepID=A0A378U6Z9_MYCFO|nr:MCE-family protein MCE3d [Mycolicibacterium fortuitum]